MNGTEVSLIVVEIPRKETPGKKKARVFGAWSSGGRYTRGFTYGAKKMDFRKPAMEILR